MKSTQQVIDRAITSTLGALNSSLALASRQLASRRLLGASFALGSAAGLALHYALSGLGGAGAATAAAAARAIVGGCLLAYSTTLANQLGALSRLAAAFALTVWDWILDKVGILEKWRQAVFVYRTGRLFEKMDSQVQAMKLERVARSASAALEATASSLESWFASTSTSVGAGWNATAASAAGAAASSSASLSATWARVDQAVGKAFGASSDWVAQIQREIFNESAQVEEAATPAAIGSGANRSGIEAPVEAPPEVPRPYLASDSGFPFY